MREGLPGTGPERPATVPLDAVYASDTRQWELAAFDAEGRRDGLVRAWRRDGAPASETTYRAGLLHGPFRRFHPDGALAREGAFVDGEPDGTVTAHASDVPGAEPLRPCCVPPGAWRLQIDFANGLERDSRFYDREGVEILPNGLPVPPHPASVPAEARYDETVERWIVSRVSARGEAEGVWRRWSTEGVLREHQEFQGGRADGLWRRWDERGALLEESGWRDGERHGVHRLLDVRAGSYRDGRVREERGAFAGGLAVGNWTLHDAQGAILRAFDLDGAGEAILAAARQAGAAGDVGPLAAALAELALPLGPEAALELAGEIAKQAEAGGGVGRLANGLARGGDAPTLLRAIASAEMETDRRARDVIDAALLLAPDHADCRVTRALANVFLGRPAEARADAARLPADWSKPRAFLELYTRVIFPEFSFWPATVEIRSLFPEVPEGPDQPAAVVRATAQKLAARLGAVRREIAARLDGAEGTPDWLPPDLSAWFDDQGPPALETWEFEEVVVDDEGETPDAPPAPAPAPTLVKVDERPPLAGRTIPALMRLARGDWAALCWLCWSAGLDRVARPDALDPPATFGQAAGLAVERLWRCRDQLTTRGLRSMTQGFPGFTWEGIDVDTMPAVLAEIAVEEYQEMRALFYWLCDAGVQSLWQDNLRSSD